MVATTLPPVLKKLRTYAVLVTSTTADDLWRHFETKIRALSYETTKIFSGYDDLLMDMENANPYADIGVNAWRSNRVNRISTAMSDVLGEDQLESLIHFTSVASEWELCVRVLFWDTDPVRGELVRSMNAVVKSFHEQTQIVDRVSLLEEQLFGIAKKQWEQEDADWIQQSVNQKRRRTEHKSHNTEQYWRNMFAKDPDAMQFYGLKTNDDPVPARLLRSVDCEWCETERKIREDREAMIARVEAEQKEDNRRHLAEYEEKQRAEEAERAKRVGLLIAQKAVEQKKQVFHCEVCDHTSRNSYDHDGHLISKRHKQRVSGEPVVLHCELCDHTSRNAYDHKNHLISKKHLQKENPAEVRPEMYVCKECDFTTADGSNFAKHKKTKKHIANVAPK